MTTTQELEMKIKQEKAKLQAMQTRLVATKHKERTGQLVAAGVLLEQIFKSQTQTERQEWTKLADRLFSRNPSIHRRLLVFFNRLDSEFPCSDKA